jgi:crotonobetainyl-CoA:carnitine CoA-transferase CaiB-like acyl-CoA transferase
MTLLADIRVVEISGRGEAAWTAKHFADWGAEVIVLEPAGGTSLRLEPPHYVADNHQTHSATWTWVSRGKSSIEIGGRFGQREAIRLCLSADLVLAESEMVPGVLGLSVEELRQTLAGKTTCIAFSPFGLTGPYAGYRAGELGSSAMGGWMAQLGDPRRQPIRPSGGPLPRVTGAFGFVAGLVALRHARRGGGVQFVDLSLQEVAASITTPGWLTKSMWDAQSERIGNLWPLGVMECADGFVGIPPLTATHWELLCQLTGIADVLDHPEGRSPAYRLKHSKELHERVKPWLAARTRMQVFEEAQQWRLPAAPVHTIADRLDCDQLAARGFWLEREIAGRAIHVPRVPYRIAGAEPTERGPLQPVGDVDGHRKPSVGAEGEARLPYAGLRVLDLTQFWSGPYATMFLGALGADVIKVESPRRPDPYRYTLTQPYRERWYEWGPAWNDTNCDKRSLILDLSSADGHAIFLRLVAQADVVISNFSNRVMPNLGLTSDELQRVNPQLIVVTMPGYGPGGPWQDYVGYAIAFEQLIYASMTGYADGPPLYGGGFCDPLVGMHTVAAIDLALLQRERTGLGTTVEVPQCEVLDSLTAPETIAYQLGAPLPSRRANKHDLMAPHDAYRCAGKDRWLTIAVSSDDEFVALTETLGVPALAHDTRFATARARRENEDALNDAISAAVLEQDAAKLESALQAAGVAACRVLKTYELTDDPQLLHRAFFQPIERAVTGLQEFKTWPFRFSSIDASHKRPPPLMGEHTHEVLRGLLRMSNTEIERLEEIHVSSREPLAGGGAGS